MGHRNHGDGDGNRATADGKTARARSIIEVDGTFDIETENWTTFVAGALYVPGQAEATEVFHWQDEEAFVDRLLSRKWTLWGHNAGRFDSLWLLRHVLRRKMPAKLAMSGSSVILLDVNGSVFRDSARLAPMTLEKFAQIGSVKKEATGLPCTCERACGGYCSIKRKMPAPLRKRMTEYLVNDCKALYSALDGISTFAERHDLDLKPTIGASSWATVKRSGVESANWDGGKTSAPSLYRKVRDSYYGGRTQVLSPQSTRGVHYDINSAYPAALSSLSLPTGGRSELGGIAASSAYASGKLGSFRASVDVPLCFLPPLPIRTKHRVAFPTGLVSGWWTGLELQAAEARGVTIRRIDEGVVWDSSEMVLAPFCRHIWSLRDAAGPKTALGTWLKFYANSLTGKLAMAPERETIEANPTVGFCPANYPCFGIHPAPSCCFHECTGACGALAPIGTIELGLFRGEKYLLAPCAHVEWAAHLTAWTRAKLIDFAGDDTDGVYMDTDSLFCEKPREKDLGDKLGEWKLEDTYRDFVALAPKTYRYTDAESGVVRAASKGIPDAVSNFDNLRVGVRVQRGVQTLKTAARKGDLFARKDLTRKIRADGVHFGDRILREDGKTWPRTVRQMDADTWELV